jgi:uncharacterized protein (TIGR00255 family)
MTGFAAVSREDRHARVAMTVKSVNHKFLDIVVRAPGSLAPMEAGLKSLIRQRLGRGRIEVTVSVDAVVTPAREVVLDEELLTRLSAELGKAQKKGLIEGGLTASDLLRLPDVLEIRAVDTAGKDSVPDHISALVEQVLADALDALIVMRETEGGFLAVDIDGRLSDLATLVDDLEHAARTGQEGVEARLRQRLSELPAEVAGDPAATAQEILRIVARSDIDEELVRLRGHLAHWRTLADGEEPCGRRLDFLVQEMNREINTVGSKAEGTTVTEFVVTGKAELERVREQVQNVE